MINHIDRLENIFKEYNDAYQKNKNSHNTLTLGAVIINYSAILPIICQQLIELSQVAHKTFAQIEQKSYKIGIQKTIETITGQKIKKTLN